MLKKTVIAFVLLLVGMQFIPLEKTNPKVDESVTLHTDEKVMSILKKSCYDCHSNETKWSIYSDIAPLSFSVISHVEDGRKALNFSNFKNIDEKTKQARFKRAIRTLKIETMPLGSYLAFHEEAKLSKEEKKILTQWFEKQIVDE